MAQPTYLQVWSVALSAATTIYVFIISPIFVWRGGFQDAADTFNKSTVTGGINAEVASGNVAQQLFWTLAGLAGLALLIRSGGWRRLRTPHIAALLAYMLLGVASLAWSDAAAISARRLLLETLILAATVSPFLSSPSPRANLVAVTAVLLLSVFLNAAFLPLKGIGAIGYSGVFNQKNELGAFTTATAFFMIWAAWQFKGWVRAAAIAALAVDIGLLLISKSKTSLGLLIILIPATLAVVLVSRIRSDSLRRAIMAGSAAIAALAVLGFILLGGTSESLSLMLFSDTTFTGRTDIWSFADRFIEQAPLLGHGYQAFWGTGLSSRAVREGGGIIGAILQAHNGYIDVMLDLGLAGLAVVILTNLLLVYRLMAVARRDQIVAYLLFGVTLLNLLNNTMESSFYRGNDMLWLLSVTVAGAAASLSLQRPRPVRPRAPYAAPARTSALPPPASPSSGPEPVSKDALLG